MSRLSVDESRSSVCADSHRTAEKLCCEEEENFVVCVGHRSVFPVLFFPSLSMPSSLCL